ncbi:MAG: hypothetical protein JWM33_1166 [Caulobacteraceae bacterium]|nr:hypothetical protein [Caulobacteraceae bacterium]
MSAFVIHPSVLIAWLASNERTSQTDSLLDMAEAKGALAPSLWRYEAANLLSMLRRRRQASEAVVDEMATALPRLRIAVDSETDPRLFGPIYALSVRRNISVYDAAYLDLAARRGLPLATLDHELRKAAHDEGVPLLP